MMDWLGYIAGVVTGFLLAAFLGWEPKRVQSGHSKGCDCPGCIDRRFQAIVA